MQYFSLLFALYIEFSFVFLVDAAPINANGSSSTSLGVLQPDHIHIMRVHKGRPLDKQHAIYLLNLVQLELYRRTVESRRDAVVSPSMVISSGSHSTGYDTLEIMPLYSPYNEMTLGSSLYGVSEVIDAMLDPQLPGDGVFEGRWVVVNMKPEPGHQMQLGMLSLVKRITTLG